MDVREKVKWLRSNYKPYSYNWYVRDHKRLDSLFIREYTKYISKINDETLLSINQEVSDEITDMKNNYRKFFGSDFDEDLRNNRKIVNRRVSLMYKNKESWCCTMLLGLHAYVDGSFNSKTLEYGSGIVVIENDKIIYTKSLSGNNPHLSSMRNVSGEIRSAMGSVAFAQKLGYKSLTIHYDYLGVENWVTGTWKRNNDFTKRYHEFMNKKIDEGMDIIFRKVKAHSNDEYNDLADKLAKQACGL